MCNLIKVQIVAKGFTRELIQAELKKLPMPITIYPWGYLETADHQLMVEISEINYHCLCDLDDSERVVIMKFIETISWCNI